MLLNTIPDIRSVASPSHHQVTPYVACYFTIQLNHSITMDIGMGSNSQALFTLRFYSQWRVTYGFSYVTRTAPRLSSYLACCGLSMQGLCLVNFVLVLASYRL